ncbi:hypothetical protein EG347_11375 [Chryseobacterium sp. G0186]|uniref:hypothetical protein n=1 Tax=Chryseobacterium sp. G0186 TaxID=2487064 RepID=UPI000F515C36|nr:hypothetical protein [Chryseobacterium sp. G0186]AZA78075.1 hypothetical protein EG347_11375 [Chryseobacterium sp. G0186]
MKIKLFYLAILFAGNAFNAQIGINTNSPQATLDVVGSAADTNKFDGIIAPRLTGLELNAKNYTDAQTGAMVYVTVAESAPTGQTVNVVSPGYYYFDGKLWSGLSTDWYTVGNSGTTAAAANLGVDISSGNYLGTNDGQNLVFATQKNVKGILDTNGNLRGGNASNTSGPYASFSWGSNNTLSNNASSSVALGRNNTVSAQGGNFPGLAIGMGNTATNGAKAIGNLNTADGANNFVFGNSNMSPGPLGLTLGNSNNNSGGIVIGSGNTASSNNIILGSANTAKGLKAMAIGFTGTANAGQIIYANTKHVFFNENNGSDTILGVNMIPTAATSTGAAIQIKGIGATANGSCTSAEEGAIRYNSATKAHEGCNGTNWKALY